MHDRKQRDPAGGAHTNEARTLRRPGLVRFPGNDAEPSRRSPSGAAAWLRAFLVARGGSAEARVVLDAARVAGFAVSTVKNVRATVATTRRAGFGPGHRTTWQLRPESSTGTRVRRSRAGATGAATLGAGVPVPGADVTPDAGGAGTSVQGDGGAGAAGRSRAGRATASATAVRRRRARPVPTAEPGWLAPTLFEAAGVSEP